ncbi:MAG: ribosome biogenesis GTP-binding protein YihA/YsxC [Endomicrobium sp.]|jgi:GTP-binding protein|nr:ribosome biogenesis GTP-binding protein YihA/YsxC [Endomicrobium sp.]
MLEKAVFFRAVTEAETLPKNIAEVIFCGRSNAGKSSAINALCSQKNLARTSKTPGRTRSINVYSVSIGRWIIDLPGYGFARVSPQEKKLWQKMIEDCIVRRKTKKSVYMIVDAFVGPTDLDYDMAYWLKDNGINFKIVANKCDKIPEVDMPEVENKIAQCFEICKNDVFAVSAKQKSGIDKLKTDIIKFLK